MRFVNKKIYINKTILLNEGYFLDIFYKSNIQKIMHNVSLKVVKEKRNLDIRRLGFLCKIIIISSLNLCY